MSFATRSSLGAARGRVIVKRVETDRIREVIRNDPATQKRLDAVMDRVKKLEALRDTLIKQRDEARAQVKAGGGGAEAAKWKAANTKHLNALKKQQDAYKRLTGRYKSELARRQKCEARR